VQHCLFIASRDTRFDLQELLPTFSGKHDFTDCMLNFRYLSAGAWPSNFVNRPKLDATSTLDVVMLPDS